MVDHGLQKPTRRGSGIFEPPFLSPGTYAAFGVKKNHWGGRHVSENGEIRTCRQEKARVQSIDQSEYDKSRHRGQLEKILIITKKGKNLLMTW